MAKVTTTSTSGAYVPYTYTCRCAFCGTPFQGEDIVPGGGSAVTRGYASDIQKELMGFASSRRASADAAFRFEYEVKRLDHYRDIVASGKLQRYFETGKVDKADIFRVEAGSALERYLKSEANKDESDAAKDHALLTAFPYEWKEFDRWDAVRCPACDKVQPWCEKVRAKGAALKAFFLGVCVFFLCMIPITGIPLLQEAGVAARLAVVTLPLVAGAVAGILAYRAMRKKRMKRLAALPWNADDLPRIDPESLAGPRGEP